MKKSQKPNRRDVTPVQEKDLSFAQGAQHVDNPAQTPMKDGPG